MPSITKVADIYRANASLGDRRNSDASSLTMTRSESSGKKSKRDEDKKSFRAILEEKIKAV